MSEGQVWLHTPLIAAIWRCGLEDCDLKIVLDKKAGDNIQKINKKWFKAWLKW
jgi:hypothetical protein